MKQLGKRQSSRNRCQSSGWEGLNIHSSAVPATIHLQDKPVLAIWVLSSHTSARDPTTSIHACWILLHRVTVSAGLCKVMVIGKKGHLFPMTRINSYPLWLEHKDLLRLLFFIGWGWAMLCAASGQWGALLCRRRVFVLSHSCGQTSRGNFAERRIVQLDATVGK